MGWFSPDKCKNFEVSSFGLLFELEKQFNSLAEQHDELVVQRGGNITRQELRLAIGGRQIASFEFAMGTRQLGTRRSDPTVHVRGRVDETTPLFEEIKKIAEGTVGCVPTKQ